MDQVFGDEAPTRASASPHLWPESGLQKLGVLSSHNHRARVSIHNARDLDRREGHRLPDSVGDRHNVQRILDCGRGEIGDVDVDTGARFFESVCCDGHTPGPIDYGTGHGAVDGSSRVDMGEVELEPCLNPALGGVYNGDHWQEELVDCAVVFGAIPEGADVFELGVGGGCFGGEGC